MSIATGVGGRFRLMWPRWQPPPHNGVIAIVGQPEVRLAWADALLAMIGAERWVWTAAERLERSGLTIARLPEVRAVTLAPVGADPRRLGLALELAVWLAERRARDGVSDAACVTSWYRPAPPAGVVRVPQVVTVEVGNGIEDELVWELLAVADALARGCPLPDQQFMRFVEAHIEGLLRLRAAARAGRLPATPMMARLLGALGEKELSIEHVYLRPDPVWTLLGGRTDMRRPTQICPDGS